MSYAEHGPKIFFSNINTQLQVDQKDGSGHRLKMIESCSDNRAWSSDPIKNIRYFKETTEQGNNGTAIMIHNMTLKEIKNDTEKDSKNLEQKLNKYGVRNFTHKAKKKSKPNRYHGVLINDYWNVMDYVFYPLNKLMNYKKNICGESETIFTGIKKNNKYNLKLNNNKNSNYLKSISNNRNKKLIKNISKSNTDISFSFSSSSFLHEHTENEFLPEEAKSEMSNIMVKNKNYYNDENDDNNDIKNSQLSDAFSELEHSNTDVELLQLKKENNELKLCLKDYEDQIKNLTYNNQNINNLQKLLTERNEELDELKNEVMNGRKIIDQLKKNLEEKKEECDTQNQQLNNLKRDAIDIISIKNERDSFANTLKDITKLLENAGYYNNNLQQDLKNLLSDHKELIILKKNLESNCSENEVEIIKMYDFINQLHEQNQSQTITINKLNKDIEEKTNLSNQYKEEITSLTRQCQKKLEIEKSFHENELSDKDCDQAFAKYFKQSLIKLKDLTNDLKDAGNDVQKRKKEINKLRIQMKENIQVFKNQYKKKNKENHFYRFRYEECQKIINQQIEDIENLKSIIDKLERKIIYKMELSVSELHQEHDSLTRKIQNLTNCIHERNMRIEELENEKVNLLNRIDHTSVQLDEQNQQVEVLKKMNSTFREKLDDRKRNIEFIFSALQSIQLQIEKVHLVSLKDKKVTLDGNYKRKIDNSIMNSENFLQGNSNNVVGDNIINTLNRTESFEYQLSSIKDNINILSNELHANVDAKNSFKNLLGQIKEKSNGCEDIYEEKVKLSEQMSD